MNTTENQPPIAATTKLPTIATAPPNPMATAVPPTDKVCYESPDGQFLVEQLVKKAAKYPPSNYPCVVLKVKAKDHTRVRNIGDYVEIMPTYKEVEELATALNEAALAAGKGKLYTILQKIPEKSKAHKARWRDFNERRINSRHKPWQHRNHRC
jgi:hypothetical protein